MPNSPEQTATLAAIAAEHGGIPDWYKGHVMKRDGRIVPLTDPAERHRSGDADCLCVEQGDDPAPDVVFVKDTDGKNTDEVAERKAKPNVSAFDEQPTIALS